MSITILTMDANNGNVYHPSWYSSEISPNITNRTQNYNQTSSYDQADGWNFKLPMDGPWYPAGYGIYKTPEPEPGPVREETPVENFLPRTSIFEPNEPVVLTTLDESRTQKYIPYMVEENSVVSKTTRVTFSEADKFSEPEFHKIEEMQPQIEITSLVSRHPDKLDNPDRGILKQNKYAKVPNASSQSYVGSNQQDVQEDKLTDRQQSTTGRTQDEGSGIESQAGRAYGSTGPPKWRRINDNQPTLPFNEIESFEREFFIFYTQFKDRTFPMNLPRGMTWYNKPEKWELYDDSGGLIVFPKSGSDFWQQTYFGKTENKDSGHLLYVPCTHNKFLMETHLTLSPRHQNDQAGVMVRYDRKNWVKAGLEFIQGQFKLTCICTLKGFSDWSVQDYMGGRSIHFRVFCLNGDIVIEHRSSHGPEKNWKVLRLAHIELQDLKPKASQIEFSENDVHGIHSMAGLYSCRPSLNNGEKVTSYAIFHFLSLKHCDKYEPGAESSQPENFATSGDEIHTGPVDFEPYYKQESSDMPTIKTYEMF